MRFTVAAAAPGGASVLDAEGAFEAFEGLLRRCEEAAHEIVFDELERLRTSGLWAYLRSRDRERLEVLSHAALAQEWQAPRVVAAVASVVVADEADVERARRAALTPLRVVVESSLRDGALIDGVLRLLGPPRLGELLAAPPTPPLIELPHSGGYGDLPQHVERDAARLGADGLPLRLVAVFDSDETVPGKVSPHIGDAVEKLKAKVPACAVHVHHQVSIENYIPDLFWAALQAGADPRDATAKALGELLSLTDEERERQKFGADNKLKKQPQGADGERPFYAALAARRLSELSPAERPAWAESLRARDTRGDLQQLVALIDSLR
jgi:hypothetical protein